MSRKLVIFTDLDSTLLDRDTYSWEPAKEALKRLREMGASLVMVSSKTLAEMSELHSELEFGDPFVIENGGGIVFNSGSMSLEPLGTVNDLPLHKLDSNFALTPLGIPYSELVLQMETVSRLAGVKTRGFSSMSIEEISFLTGLSPDRTRLSRIRYYDEPFVIDGNNEEVDRLQQMFSNVKLSMERGGRFWHLFGHGGKGQAVSILIAIFKEKFGEFYSIGLGDSPNDLSFLKIMDLSFLLGQSMTEEFSGMSKIKRCADEGPGAWNELVLKFLSDRKEFL